MKKIYLLTLPFILGLVSNIQAQTTLPNGGFEAWQNSGSNDEEPTSWNGNKTGGGFANLGPQTCFQETSGVHSGAYCLKLRNGAIFGIAVNASATTGRIEVPSLDTSDGYIHSITTDPDFSSAFTGRPDSLVGWFKFTQGGSDTGGIRAILHDSNGLEIPDQGNSASYEIGQASYEVTDGDSNIWTRFSVPFTYLNEDTPSYILLIAMASTNVGDADPNTTLWVDDLSVVYSTVGVEENDFGDKFQIYPNPTEGNFSIDLGTNHKSVTVHISGLNGNVIQSEQFNESQLLNLKLEEPAGTYLVTIIAENKKAVIRLVKE